LRKFRGDLREFDGSLKTVARRVYLVGLLHLLSEIRDLLKIISIPYAYPRYDTRYVGFV
jgi:hypothetical protein